MLLIVINGMLLCYKKAPIAAEQHAALPFERGVGVDMGGLMMTDDTLQMDGY